MLETLKKTVFAGVGATVMSADAVKSVLAELVNKGKLSAEDAKNAFSKAAERGEEDAKALYEKAATRGKKALEGIPYLVSPEHLAALEKRIAVLEEKLGVPAPAPANDAEEANPEAAEKEAVPAPEAPRQQ